AQTSRCFELPGRSLGRATRFRTIAFSVAQALAEGTPCARRDVSDKDDPSPFTGAGTIEAAPKLVKMSERGGSRVTTSRSSGTDHQPGECFASNCLNRAGTLVVMASMPAAISSWLRSSESTVH